LTRKIVAMKNKEFKRKFFSSINFIEKNITIKQDEKFRNSLEFISKYVHVSLDEKMNYSNTYPLGIFSKDKQKWLEWYEINKCSYNHNKRIIQLKNKKPEAITSGLNIKFYKILFESF
jgi:hypothetical protein